MDKVVENERIKTYYKNNPDKRKATQQKYYLANKEKIKLITTLYRKENKAKVNIKANNTAKYRKQFDPIYKLKCGLRRNICMLMKRGGYNKSAKTIEILGCSYDDFKQHIESNFESWMNWNNHGQYNGSFNFGWDIDHIIPLSKGNSLEEIIELSHYTNLQPLCSKINRDIKKDK